MSRSMRLAGLFVVASMVLSGCLSLDADMAVNSDATATGELTFEVEEQVAGFLGISSSEDLVEQLSDGEIDGAEAAQGLDCEAVDRSGVIAVSCAFENERFSQEDELWWIASDGSDVIFRSKSSEDSANAGAEFFGDVFSSGGYTISVTMPAPITSVSGDFVQQTSDTSFRIKASLSDEFDVRVVSPSGEPAPPDASVWLWVVLALLIVIVVSVVIYLVIRRKNRLNPSGENVPELG